MKSRLELGLIEGENLVRKSALFLINNIGKTVALITLIAATLLTFTDVTLADFGAESFLCSAGMLILASYLMYFSLEDAGEKLGEESEEYKSALAKYEAECDKVRGEDIDSLRKYCLEYSKQELEYRRYSYLVSHVLSLDEFESYLNGSEIKGIKAKIFRRAARMKAIPISPKSLLTKEREERKSELKSPERFKLPRLILKLIPTTVCMTVTVSVMLSAKPGLDTAKIIEGIMKLSTLIIVGFRGYASGYGYIRKCYLPWLETKRRLLEGYNEKKELAT